MLPFFTVEGKFSKKAQFFTDLRKKYKSVKQFTDIDLDIDLQI